MKSKHAVYVGVAVVAVAMIWAWPAEKLGAQQPFLPLIEQLSKMAIDADDIGGVVTGASGPEAGVWVIAETNDLPTRFAKIVVTDDQGRYVVPDLPKAKYKLWVRGYRLIDSPKVDGEPGKQVNLRAVPAPNASAAAQFYPTIFWFLMLNIPCAD